MATYILYSCEICGAFHPWTWDGDCRDDANRYDSDEDYIERNNLPTCEEIEVRDISERAISDAGLQVRHDMLGFYVCTDEEGEYEDVGRNSVGFDGRPHYTSIEEAVQAAESL